MDKKEKIKVVRRFVKTSLFAAGLSFSIVTFSKMDSIERKIPPIFSEQDEKDNKFKPRFVEEFDDRNIAIKEVDSIITDKSKKLFKKYSISLKND